MQTFKQYLEEADLKAMSKSHVQKNKNLIALVKKIKSQCGPYIAELKKMKNPGLLTRGTNVTSSSGIKKSRPNREPHDSTRVMHEFMNYAFKTLFNWEARSNHSVFCFGNTRAYEKHGNTYGGDTVFVFPIGPLKYLYSPKIEDLYQELEQTKFPKPLSLIVNNSWSLDSIHYDLVWSFMKEASTTEIGSDLMRYLDKYTDDIDASNLTSSEPKFSTFRKNVRGELNSKRKYADELKLLAKLINVLDNQPDKFDDALEQLFNATMQQKDSLIANAKKQFISVIERGEYTSSDLAKQMEIQQPREIMLNAAEYFYINVDTLASQYLNNDDSFSFSDIEKLLWEALVNDNI